MNMKFNCDNCGADMTATIWDEDATCGVCGAEHSCEVKRVDVTTFEWSWAATDGDLVEPDGGEGWEDMGLAEYIQKASDLVNLVHARQLKGDLLTVHQAAKLLGVTWDTIVNMAEDKDLNVNVGVQVGGHGGPVGDIPMAEWTMEDLDFQT